MKKITSAAELKEAIQVLELDRAHQFEMLKSQVHITLESMKPINIIKKTIKDAVASSEIRSDLVDGTIGMVAGYLSKKILLGKSGNVVKNTFGDLIQLAISSIVSKNTTEIKSVGINLLKKIFSKK